MILVNSRCSDRGRSKNRTAWITFCSQFQGRNARPLLLGVLFGTSLDESVLVVSNRVRHESCMNMMSLTGAPTEKFMKIHHS